MAVRKTAISIPDDLLDQVDRAAADLGESRSRYITRILRAAVRARRDAEVTRRLDLLYTSEPLNRQQVAVAHELDDEDDDWREQGW